VDTAQLVMILTAHPHRCINYLLVDRHEQDLSAETQHGSRGSSADDMVLDGTLRLAGTLAALGPCQ
jgi:hypothetical protein